MTATSFKTYRPLRRLNPASEGRSIDNSSSSARLGIITAILAYWRRSRPPDPPDYLRDDLGLPPAYHPVRQWDIAMSPHRGLFDDR